MQRRAALLLLSAAIISGLTCLVYNMYLTSSNSHDYIKVALEIPLSKLKQSTNLELNIQSFDTQSQILTQKQQKLEDERDNEMPYIPLRDYYVMWDDEEGENDLGEDRDNYVVLLDTGDYNLEEIDMDKTKSELQTLTTTHRHTRTKHKRKQVQTLPPVIESTPEILKTNDHESNQQLMRGEIIQPPSVNRDNNSTHNKQVGPYVISKEEFARQATDTTPPTITTSHHTTTTTTTTTTAGGVFTECTHPPCLQYLNTFEKSIFNKCQKKLIPHKSSNKLSPPDCQCRFRDSRGHKRVAIVSLPGSGNTWIRGLIEKTTGFCTGSIYCDKTLREGGFCGEGLRGTNLIAVKTHDSSLQWKGGKMTDTSRPDFDKAIFLIRNPFNAIIAEWNRQMSKKYATDQTGSSHVKFVSNKAFFGNQLGWQSLVKYLTHKWKLMISSNMRASLSGRSVLVVFFEEIKKDPALQLAKMMEFLEVSVSPTAINTAIMDDFTTFYRNHTDSFDHYTKEQRMLVNNVITNTAGTIHDQHIATYLREYIQY